MERIRRIVPEVTLRTTLIAGFPGETEEDFDELCDFVEEGFSITSAFSRTRAKRKPAHTTCPTRSTTTRRRIARNGCATLRTMFARRLLPPRVGKTMDVLIEGREEDGQLFGRAMCQAPEVDGVTYVDNGEPGNIVQVTITDTLLYEMEGE